MSPSLPPIITDPFFSLSDKAQDEYLYDVAKRAAKDISKEAPPASPAGTEVFLRDMAASLFILGGAKPKDLDFMFRNKPDGSRVKTLDRVICNYLRSASPASKMAHGSDLVNKIVADCQALGIVGEENLLLAIYLVGTSRLLDRPLSAIVQGASSTGKSYLLSQVARLFPVESVLHATHMTPQALYHLPSVAHKFVVAGERSRRQDDDAADATGALRQLISERQITKLVTEQHEGKWTTRTVSQEGPIAYIETTTLRLGAIFAEDLNRALLLKTDETEDHTRQILAQSASRYGASQTKDVSSIVKKHRDFQALLKRRSVSIPFASQVVESIPVRKVEARRVGQQILSMIEAITLLHQFQRKVDAQGRLIAELQDYEIAARILRQPLGESLGVASSPAKLYEKLASRFPEGKVFTTADVQKLDRSAGERTVRGWLTELADHGCIERAAASKGPKSATWILTGKRPEEAVLPSAPKLDLLG